MLSRVKKMKSSCPKGGFRTWSSIGGIQIFNGIAQSVELRLADVVSVLSVYSGCGNSL